VNTSSSAGLTVRLLLLVAFDISAATIAIAAGHPGPLNIDYRRSSLKSLTRNSSTRKSATCHQSRQADYRINALFSQEELRNTFRPYRSALLCAKFSAVSLDKPLVELSACFSDLLAVGAARVRT
jgi:hypothetical protein